MGQILPGLNIEALAAKFPALLTLPTHQVEQNLVNLASMLYLEESPTVLFRVVRHAPSLLGYNSVALEEKLSALSFVFNMSTGATAKLVTSKGPGLLTLSTENNIKPSFVLLRQLIPVGCPHVLVRTAPSLLFLSEQTLREKISKLREVLSFLEEGEFLRLISLAPSVLTLNVENNLVPKLRQLQLLFARKPPTEEANKLSKATRRLTAQRLVLGTGGKNMFGVKASSKAMGILGASLRLKLSDRVVSIGEPGVESIQSPLLPRHEVMRLLLRAPTLLQRNVSSSLAPKLKFLRSYVGQNCTNAELAAPADVLVRTHPRLLLSSFSVLGRLVFLSNCSDKQLDSGVSPDVARAAIKASKKSFFADYPGYTAFLRLRSHVSEEVLENAHGNALKEIYGGLREELLSPEDFEGNPDLF